MEGKQNKMAPLVKLSYGVGHVFNDLCASMWFTYLLIFYEKVLLFDPTVAGLVLLVGQVADGACTPIVGLLSDMENKITFCARYGRRKIWHLIGTIFVAVSFPFIYNVCLGCETADQWTQFGYYCVFVVLFQFGWACVQISHLALIPDLSSKKHHRTELNSIRYAFTVLANLSVFAITFFVLKAGGGSPNCTTTTVNATTTPIPSTLNPLTITLAPDTATNLTTTTPVPSTLNPLTLTLALDTATNLTTTTTITTTTDSVECSDHDSIGPEDADQFRDIALICVGVGLFFSILFHVGVKEPPFKKPKHQHEENNVGHPATSQAGKKMRVIDWFKEPPFYQIAVLYMATRLYVNLYQVYIPLYVQDTLFLDKSYVATVPFAMYLAGFAGSLIMKQVNRRIGRKGTYLLGCSFGLAGCTWIWFGSGSYYTEWGIFLVAALLGIGGSTLLITSLSITADLIGNNVEGGAFVYGFMSFTDKLSNGIIIMVIQDSNSGDSEYYRYVITFACGSACVVGIGVTLSLIGTRVSQRRGVSSPVMELLEESDTSDQQSSEDSGTEDEVYNKKNASISVVTVPTECHCGDIICRHTNGGNMTNLGSENPAYVTEDSTTKKECY